MNNSMTIEIVGDATTMQEGVGTSTPPNMVIGPDNNYYQLPEGATEEHLSEFFSRMDTAFKGIGEGAVKAVADVLPSKQSFEELGQAVLDPKFYEYLKDSAIKYYSEPENTLSTAALATSGIPVVGDVFGAASDITNLYRNPEERTWYNYLFTGAGAIPFIPPIYGIIRKQGEPILPGTVEKELNAWVGTGKGSELFEKTDELNRQYGANRKTFFEQLIGPNPDLDLLDKVKLFMHGTYKKYLYERFSTEADEVLKMINKGKVPHLISGFDVHLQELLENTARKAEIARQGRTSTEREIIARQKVLRKTPPEVTDMPKLGENTGARIYEDAGEASYFASPAHIWTPRIDVKAYGEITGMDKWRKSISTKIFDKPYDDLSEKQKEFLDRYIKSSSYYADDAVLWLSTGSSFLRPDVSRMQRMGLVPKEVPYYVAARVAEGIYEAVKNGDIRAANVPKLQMEKALEVANKAIEKKLLRKFESGDLKKKNILAHLKKIGAEKTYPPVTGSPKGTGWYGYKQGMDKDDVMLGLSIDTQGSVRVDDEHVLYGQDAIRAATADQKKAGDICVGQCNFNMGDRTPMVELDTLKKNPGPRGEEYNLYTSKVLAGDWEIYSLRDIDNGMSNAVVTVDSHGIVSQAKGVQNGPIPAQYQPQVIDLLNDIRKRTNAPSNTVFQSSDKDNFKGIIVYTQDPRQRADPADYGYDVDPNWEWGHSPTIRASIKEEYESIKDISGGMTRLSGLKIKLLGFMNAIDADLDKRIQPLDRKKDIERIKEIRKLRTNTSNLLNKILDDLDDAYDRAKFYEDTDRTTFNRYFKYDESKFKETMRKVEAFEKHPLWEQKTPMTKSEYNLEVSANVLDYAARHQDRGNAYLRQDIDNRTLADMMAEDVNNINVEGIWEGDDALRQRDVIAAYFRIQLNMPQQQADELATIVDDLDDWNENLYDTIRDYLTRNRAPAGWGAVEANPGLVPNIDDLLDDIEF